MRNGVLVTVSRAEGATGSARPESANRVKSSGARVSKQAAHMS